MIDKRKRFVQLSWEILEHKCRYYRGVGGKPIADAEYDALEDEYRKLAEELGEKPSAWEMVGFNIDRPSCRLVMAKLTRRNK